jgi:hypothetical protein
MVGRGLMLRKGRDNLSASSFLTLHSSVCVSI